MGIFGILILIFLMAAYSMFGLACLSLFKLQVNFTNVIVFTVSGCIAGFASIVLYGWLFSDKNGTLSSTEQVIGMFVSAGAVALLASICSVKLAKSITRRSTGQTG